MEKQMNWDKLTAIEPALLEVEQLAYRIHHNHCKGGWHRLCVALTRCCGPIGNNPALRSREAYVVARRRLQSIFLVGEPMQRVPTDSWEADDRAHAMETRA